MGDPAQRRHHVRLLPRGELYEALEVAKARDWVAAATTVQATPVQRPLPEGAWIAYPRAPIPPTKGHTADPAEEHFDWLLRAITAEGANVNQRRYDLETLAQFITDHRLAGYGRMPLDTDVHPEDCIICMGVEDFTMDPPGLSRDGHPYTDAGTLKIKAEFEWLFDAALALWAGSGREDFNNEPATEYLRAQAELLMEVGAVEHPDGWDHDDIKAWLIGHIITEVILKHEKER